MFPLRISIAIFSLITFSVLAQSEPIKKTSLKTHEFITFGAGGFFSKGSIPKNDFNIKSFPSVDLNLFFGWTHLGRYGSGWDAQVRFVTQTTSYEDTVGKRKYDTFLGRVCFVAGGIYPLISKNNFDFYGELSPLLSITTGSSFDSTAYFSGGVDYYIPHKFGGGLNLGSKFVFTALERLRLFANVSYEFGFNTFGKVLVGEKKRYSVLEYKGSGIFVQFGFMFFPPPTVLEIGGEAKRRFYVE